VPSWRLGSGRSRAAIQKGEVILPAAQPLTNLNKLYIVLLITFTPSLFDLLLALGVVGALPPAENDNVESLFNDSDVGHRSYLTIVDGIFLEKIDLIFKIGLDQI